MPDWTYYFVKKENEFCNKDIPPTIIRISANEGQLEIFAGILISLREAFFTHPDHYSYRVIKKDEADKFKSKYAPHKK